LREATLVGNTSRALSLIRSPSLNWQNWQKMRRARGRRVPFRLAWALNVTSPGCASA